MVRLLIGISVLASAAPGGVPTEKHRCNTEFEVVSIRTNAAQPGFHFASDAVSGGPGSADPAMFRCSRCSLATLIVKAFNLQPYQFPGRKTLADSTYDIVAKIPAGATPEDFSAMLQNMLRNRFGLTSHFQEKSMKGYRLVIGKDGPKLKESTGTSLPPAAGQRWAISAESHNHTGAVILLATLPPTGQRPIRKPQQISPASSRISSVFPSMTKPALPASTIFPSAGPAQMAPMPAVTPMAPSLAARDTPATMAREVPHPVPAPNPPAPRSSTLSSNNWG